MLIRMPRKLYYFLIFSLIVLSVGCWREKLVQPCLEGKINKVKVSFYFVSDSTSTMSESYTIIKNKQEIRKLCNLISDNKAPGYLSAFNRKIDYFSGEKIIYTLYFHLSLQTNHVFFRKNGRNRYFYLTEDGYKVLKEYENDFLKRIGKITDTNEE